MMAVIVASLTLFALVVLGMNALLAVIAFRTLRGDN